MTSRGWMLPDFPSETTELGKDILGDLETNPSDQMLPLIT